MTMWGIRIDGLPSSVLLCTAGIGSGTLWRAETFPLL
jgi:hypothetical protein